MEHVGCILGVFGNMFTFNTGVENIQRFRDTLEQRCIQMYTNACHVNINVT